MISGGVAAGESSQEAADHSQPGRGLRIMAFPSRGNAYVDCFYPAVEALGAEVHEGVYAMRWLLANLRDFDYVHLHWPSFQYSGHTRAAAAAAFGRFLLFLALIRSRGTRVVWTVHNLYPHDACPLPVIDRIARRALARAGSLFPVHGPSAEQVVLREFPAMKGRTLLIQHGHWMNYYPSEMTRQEARRRQGLEAGDRVFLFFGTCKPYKGLEDLIRAFERLPGDPILVIAGKFQSAEYEAGIRAMASRSPRIRLHPGFVPREEAQVYLNACDVVVAPYSKILTSGTVVLAMSFGRPVVAPAFGSVRDTVQEGCGVLYDPAESDGLENAMRTAMGAQFDDTHIRAEIAKHTWRYSATVLCHAMQRLRAHAT